MIPALFNPRHHRRRLARKLAIAAAAAFAGLGGAQAALVAPAQAGTFDVTGCFNAEQYSWAPFKSGGGTDVYTECPGGFNGGVGVAARNIQGVGATAANGDIGFHRFSAPSGATLTRIRGSFAYTAGNGWKAGLYRPDTASWIESTTADLRTADGGVVWGSYDHSLTDAATTKLELMVRCGASVGCPTDHNAAGALGTSLTVTVNDPSAPGLSNGQGLWTHNNWVSGNQSVSFDASDNTGLKHSWVDVDGGTQYGRRDFPCDYRFTVPCAGGTQQTPATIPTANFADGTHTLRLVAYDAAGNPSTTSKTIYTDNTAPSTPVLNEQVAENSAGWTTSDQARFTYAVPSSAAPVNKTTVDVCNAAGTCSTQTITTGGGDGDDTITLPNEGVYTVKARLSDAAGNISATSAAFTVSYEKTAPGAADPAEANGWIGKKEAADYVQRISGLQSGEWMPVSKLAGFAVTTDGSQPGTQVTDGMTGETPSMTIAQLSEGVTTIKARAISNAGLASASVGTTQIPVDLTEPTVSVAGTPASETQWQPKQAELLIKGVDPKPANGAAASGMTGATGTDHTKGAYVEYSLDGRAWEPVKGDEAAVSVGDGEHKITYRAFDVAGNVSETKTTVFKVDATAPSPVAFEMPDASAPKTVTVVANDVTSGVDFGRIETRAVGSTEWKPLGSAIKPDADGRIVSSLDGLSGGQYQLRATVTDHAGNTTITERTVDGGTYVVDIPKSTSGTDGGDGGGGGDAGAAPGGKFPGEILPGGGKTPDLQSGTGYKGGDIGNGHSGEGNPDGTKTQVLAGFVQKTKAAVKKCAKAGKTAKSKKAAAKCQKRLAKAMGCKAPGKTPKSKKAAARCIKKAQKVRARGEKLVTTLKLGYGKTAIMRGTVTTLDGKTPIANGEVAIWSEAKSVWASKGNRVFQQIATLKTNAKGVFAYRVPKGTTRIIRAEYVGDAKTADSWADSLVHVTTRVTIKANKKSLRNKQSVRLSGKLAKPIPAAGKIVSIQAHDGKKWRTIGNTRASKEGSWKFSYRFTRTTGVRTYKFRVQAPSEAAYDYESGRSKAVAVKVRG